MVKKKKKWNKKSFIDKERWFLDLFHKIKDLIFQYIFDCKELENYRNKSLPFLDDDHFFLELCNDNWTKILGWFFRFRKRLW